MKEKILYSKYDAYEFVAADGFLITGGFLLGTNFQSEITTILGTISIVVGLFLGLRVLLKFSSDLRGTKTLVDNAAETLRKTNKNVQTNEKSLINANNELKKTKSDLIQTKRELDSVQAELKKSTKEFQKASEKIFGHSMAFSRSSWSNPLDRTVQELKKDVDELKKDKKKRDRGW